MYLVVVKAWGVGGRTWNRGGGRLGSRAGKYVPCNYVLQTVGSDGIQGEGQIRGWGGGVNLDPWIMELCAFEPALCGLSRTTNRSVDGKPARRGAGWSWPEIWSGASSGVVMLDIVYIPRYPGILASRYVAE